MNVRIALTWSALHSLEKVWKYPIKKQTKTTLLYGSESWTLNVARLKRLDCTYTRMLRLAYNISWNSQPTNKVLYGSVPRVSEVIRRRRLALARHVSRHDEPAGRLLLWSPDAKRRVGRPYVTLKPIIEEEAGLTGTELISAMADRELWQSDFIHVSPVPTGIG